MLEGRGSPGSNVNQMRLATAVTMTGEAILDYSKLRINGTGLSCLLYVENTRDLALFVISPAWSQDLPGE